ncbi:uncharacterized protein DS421_9g259200 [Arachis hypogaea]|nr:uncharacterized protein DS421_9g259200 [Arachis hypogaea]
MENLLNERSKNHESPRPGYSFTMMKNRVQESHKLLHKTCIQQAKQPKLQSFQNKNKKMKIPQKQSYCAWPISPATDVKLKIRTVKSKNQMCRTHCPNLSSIQRLTNLQ